MSPKSDDSTGSSTPGSAEDSPETPMISPARSTKHRDEETKNEPERFTGGLRGLSGLAAGLLRAEEGRSNAGNTPNRSRAASSTLSDFTENGAPHFHPRDEVLLYRPEWLGKVKKAMEAQGKATCQAAKLMISAPMIRLETMSRGWMYALILLVNVSFIMAAVLTTRISQKSSRVFFMSCNCDSTITCPVDPLAYLVAGCTNTSAGLPDGAVAEYFMEAADTENRRKNLVTSFYVDAVYRTAPGQVMPVNGASYITLDADFWACLKQPKFCTSDSDYHLVSSRKDVRAKIKVSADGSMVTWRTAVVLPGGVFYQKIRQRYRHKDQPQLFTTPGVTQSYQLIYWKAMGQEFQRWMFAFALAVVGIVSVVWIAMVYRAKPNLRDWMVEQWWLVLLCLCLLLFINPVLLSIEWDPQGPEGRWTDLFVGRVVMALSGCIYFFVLVCLADRPRLDLYQGRQLWWRFFASKLLIATTILVGVVGMAWVENSRMYGSNDSELLKPSSWDRHRQRTYLVFAIMTSIGALLGFIMFFLRVWSSMWLLARLPYGLTRYQQLTFRVYLLLTLLSAVVILLALSANAANSVSILNSAFEDGSSLTRAVDIFFGTYNGSLRNYINMFYFLIYWGALLFMYAPPTDHSQFEIGMVRCESQLRGSLLQKMGAGLHLGHRGQTGEPLGYGNDSQRDGFVHKGPRFAKHVFVATTARWLLDIAQQAYKPDEYEREVRALQKAAGGSSRGGSQGSSDLLDDVSSTATESVSADDTTTRPPNKPLDMMDVESFGFTIVRKIWNPETDTHCLVVRHQQTNRLVVAFRGTNSRKHLQEDLQLLRVRVNMDTFMEEQVKCTKAKRRLAELGQVTCGRPPAYLTEGLPDGHLAEWQKNRQGGLAVPRCFQSTLGRMRKAGTAVKHGDKEEVEEAITSAFTRYAGVHSGFWRAYSSVREALHHTVLEELKRNPSQLFLTGHSLGGALTTIAAYDLSLYLLPKVNPHSHAHHNRPGNLGRLGIGIQVYTFGAPRVGTASFAARYHTLVPVHFRVVCDGDVITGGPKGMGYVQVGHHVLIDNLGFGNTIVDPSAVELLFQARPAYQLASHKLSSYIRAVDGTLRLRCDAQVQDRIRKEIQDCGGKRLVRTVARSTVRLVRTAKRSAVTKAKGDSKAPHDTILIVADSSV